MKPSVKFVGASGQISLGKQYAGRQVLVEEPEPGVWLVRTAKVVPDNERWLHTPAAKQALGEAYAWAAATPAQASDLSALSGGLDDKNRVDRNGQSRSVRRSGSKQRRVPAKLVRA